MIGGHEYNFSLKYWRRKHLRLSDILNQIWDVYLFCVLCSSWLPGTLFLNHTSRITAPPGPQLQEKLAYLGSSIYSNILTLAPKIGYRKKKKLGLNPIYWILHIALSRTSPGWWNFLKCFGQRILFFTPIIFSTFILFIW